MLFPRTLRTRVGQNGSACGLFPWSLAGTFPFGGPFTDGPFTAGAAAAAAAATGAVAVGTGVAVAAVTALPGFGTPIPWGAAGACPPSAAPPIPPCGTAAGAGLAPSEHPVNPLAAPARASAVTAHHTHLTGIGKNPPDGRLVDSITARGPNESVPRSTSETGLDSRIGYTPTVNQPFPPPHLHHVQSQPRPPAPDRVYECGWQPALIRTGCHPKKSLNRSAC